MDFRQNNSSLELVDDRPMDLVAEVFHGAPGQVIVMGFHRSVHNYSPSVFLLSVERFLLSIDGLKDDWLLVVGKLPFWLGVDPNLELYKVIFESLNLLQ